MEKPTRLAFDLGGVIIERGPLQTFQNFLIQQSIESVKLTVQKFSPKNVFIISKSKEKYIKGNIEFLKKHEFFEITGFLQENLYFVDRKEDKGVIGKQLGIDFIVDDSITVAKIVIESGFKPILFGDHPEFLKQNNEVINAKNWESFREILQNIKN